MRVKELVLRFTIDELRREAERQGDWIVPRREHIGMIVKSGIGLNGFWIDEDRPDGRGLYYSVPDNRLIEISRLFRMPSVVLVDKKCKCPNCGKEFEA